MDGLLQKYNDYKRLKNCRAEYVLSNEMMIDFTYKKVSTFSIFSHKSLNCRYILIL